MGMAKLLIVDDDSGILSALRRSLRREGWKILLADSPGKALRILEQGPVDLVLSDQKMPGMTGTDLLAEVARRSPNTTRILITGWAEAVSKREVAEIGIKALIPKPWDDAELKSVLHQHLG
jgi:response regulator RpfG family c-di-GMP phosphodiesterase